MGLVDYKLYCFEGMPKFLYASCGLEDHKTAQISFLTTDWEFAPFRRNDFKGVDQLPTKLDHFDEMIDIARKLSEGMHFIRVDLYEIEGRVYFSELTFYPNGGFMKFEPEEYDKKIGELIELSVDEE
ncbi:MAG: hypothetical protein J6O61_15415 [Butyrivibrio sp.]|uniref:ATP-grasp fold amidoligase family protein n=1 Tax=Butyrivibrio sp. TaxID=28121 RepID=UPI001B07C842|nr:ATP-grasp fold amidoligase family protein [Butyrivibrio sp.]MBO6242192.1 hypothetical protein [Butyrivibrio sp.]